MWGSGASGKLGLGPEALTAECYCSLPTPVALRDPRDGALPSTPPQRVRKVSCGSAHTAAIAEDGSLWVWGCGDGGRLGLGRDDKASKPSPVRVDELLHERMGDVSCGVSHTLAASAIVEETTGDGNDKMKVRRLPATRAGGAVAAGAVCRGDEALGPFFFLFSLLSLRS